MGRSRRVVRKEQREHQAAETAAIEESRFNKEKPPSPEMAPCPRCGGPCRTYATKGLKRYRKCEGLQEIPGCGWTFSESVRTRHQVDWAEWLSVSRQST